MEAILEKLLLLLMGAVAGFATARVKWSIEKEKMRVEARRNQIQKWRESIHKEFEEIDFADTVTYSEMRPHLSPATLNSIEGGSILIRDGRGGNLIKSLVLDDLAALEKKWELI